MELLCPWFDVVLAPLSVARIWSCPLCDHVNRISLSRHASHESWHRTCMYDFIVLYVLLLQFLGLLNPLDAPHHLRIDVWNDYREGVVRQKSLKEGHGSYVDIGLKKVGLYGNIFWGMTACWNMCEIFTLCLVSCKFNCSHFFNCCLWHLNLDHWPQWQ